jgi:hypothetical protein
MTTLLNTKELNITRTFRHFREFTYNPYRPGELADLKERILNASLSDWIGSKVESLLDDISYALYEHLKYGYVYDTVPYEDRDGDRDERFIEISFMQFLILYHKRVFLFLTQVPLNNVVLYMDDPLLSCFADWRITIGK